MTTPSPEQEPGLDAATPLRFQRRKPRKQSELISPINRQQRQQRCRLQRGSCRSTAVAAAAASGDIQGHAGHDRCAAEVDADGLFDSDCEDKRAPAADQQHVPEHSKQQLQQSVQAAKSATAHAAAAARNVGTTKKRAGRTPKAVGATKSAAAAPAAANRTSKPRIRKRPNQSNQSQQDQPPCKRLAADARYATIYVLS